MEKLRCVKSEVDDCSYVYVFSTGSHFTGKEKLCFRDDHLLCPIPFSFPTSHQLPLASHLTSYKSLLHRNSCCSAHRKDSCWGRCGEGPSPSAQLRCHGSACCPRKGARKAQPDPCSPRLKHTWGSRKPQRKSLTALTNLYWADADFQLQTSSPKCYFFSGSSGTSLRRLLVTRGKGRKKWEIFFHHLALGNSLDVLDEASK